MELCDEPEFYVCIIIKILIHGLQVVSSVYVFAKIAFL